MVRLGFIGTGIMGCAMVENLIKNGFEVYIHTRTKAKAERLMTLGAKWCDDVDTVCKHCDTIVTMLGYPSDVEEVYERLLASAKPLSYLIDMTTSSPELAKEIHAKALERDLHFLDAPVSGGQVGAKNATLSIMVGGTKEDFEHCVPIFNAIGKNIRRIGLSGAGQIAKAANQTAIAGTLAGVCEAIRLCQSEGVNASEVLLAIQGGAAASFQLSHTAPLMLDDDMTPSFYLKHYVKDLSIASNTAKANHLNLPVLTTVLEMFKHLEQQGEGNFGTQALIHEYQKGDNNV